MSQQNEPVIRATSSDSFHYDCYLTDGTTEIGVHRHNYLEFVYIVEGDINVAFNDKKILTMRKGALMPFSSADRHEFCHDENHHCLFYVAHIDGYRLPNAITAKFIETAGSPLFCQSETLYHQVKSEFDLLYAEINGDPSSPERENIIINIFSRLVYLCCRIFYEQNVSLDGMPKELRSALAYINNYFQHPLSLDEVAEHVGLSRFKFSKMFHKSLHVTFQAHLLEKRLQWAHYALQSANAPIAVIAEQAGFRSRSYFCSKFKSRFGVSPTEMKRKSTR